MVFARDRSDRGQAAERALHTTRRIGTLYWSGRSRPNSPHADYLKSRIHDMSLSINLLSTTHAISTGRIMTSLDSLPVTLIDLLSNSLVLRQLSPYIPVHSLLSLATANKAIRSLITSQPEPWRHLDLTSVKSVNINFESGPIDVGGVSWRAERMDESLTSDDFFSGPLRSIFNRLHSKRILQCVQTMILDGLMVPADLVREIICEERYSVRILSLREAKEPNHSKLQQILRYAVRPTRAEGTPKLKALYFFQPKDAPRAIAYHQRLESGVPLGVMAAEGAQIGAEWNHRSSNALSSSLNDDESKWYGCSGRIMKRPVSDWPETLQVCKGLIAFDAVLCRGPQHDISKTDSRSFLQPTIATVALGSEGCESCGTCPEGPAIFGESAESALPRSSPPPTHSSTVRAAQHPQTENSALGKFPKLILRCEDCLRGRYCERCQRWWCDECVKSMGGRVQTSHVTLTWPPETPQYPSCTV